jgi:PAS domain S-box-containing protein
VIFAAPARQIFGLPHLSEEILSTVQEPFAVLDAELRLIAATEAFFLRFGLDKAAGLGCRIYDLGGGEWDTPGTHELLDRVAPHRDLVEGYSLEVQAGGLVAPRVFVTVRPIRTGQNMVSCYLLAFAEPEPELDTEEVDLIRRTRRHGGDLVVVLEGRSLRILHAEGGARELTGYMAAQLEGLPLSSMLHPDERANIVESVAALAAGEPHRRLTFRLRHRALRFVWVEALCGKIEDHDGPAVVHIAARDVTERKRAEEALRWLGRQTKLILDSAGDGIFGVDRAGTITFVNPAAARAVGYRVPELLGRSYRLLFGAEAPAPDSTDVVAQTLEDGLGRVLGDFSLRCVDGSSIPVELSCSVAREHGLVTGAVITFRDISERKRAEAEARRGEWLSGVGETALALRNEINNPLTTILAEARLLEMGGNTPEEEREMVDAICGEARRIADVIRRLAERQDAPRVRVEGSQRMLDLR